MARLQLLGTPRKTVASGRSTRLLRWKMLKRQRELLTESGYEFWLNRSVTSAKAKITSSHEWRYQGGIFRENQRQYIESSGGGGKRPCVGPTHTGNKWGWMANMVMLCGWNTWKSHWASQPHPKFGVTWGCRQCYTVCWCGFPAPAGRNCCKCEAVLLQEMRDNGFSTDAQIPVLKDGLGFAILAGTAAKRPRLRDPLDFIPTA